MTKIERELWLYYREEEFKQEIDKVWHRCYICLVRRKKGGFKAIFNR